MATRKLAPGNFECEAAYAPAAYNERGVLAAIPGDTIKEMLRKANVTLPGDVPAQGLPVALRWRVRPDLGLPITAFKVWRKIKKTSLASVAVNMANVFFGYLFTNGPFSRISGTVRNTTIFPTTVTLKPLNHLFSEYSSKTITLSLAANSTASFSIEQPNMNGLRVEGGATLENVTGINIDAYINDPDWQLIQVVGVPFKKGYIDNDLYKYEEQGYMPAASLKAAELAAIDRVELHKIFYKGHKPTAPDGATMPTWKVPTGNNLLSAYYKDTPIKNGVTGTLNDIKEMLNQVYKVAPSLLLGKQKNYLKEVKSLGIQDPANTAPKDNGTYQNPVCAITLLSAGTDCWNALGLGFGTLDIVPFFGSNITIAAVPGGLAAFDYMVTAVFREPVIEIFQPFPWIEAKEKLAGFTETEYAALSHYNISMPPAPVSLLAEKTGENRPLAVDDFYYQQNRVSWLRSDLQLQSPLCYSVGYKNAITGAATSYLNSPRPYITDCPQPLMPALRADPDAEDPPGRDGSNYDKFCHDRSPFPFIGSVSHRYYVAAQNVFGLWSDWQLTDSLQAAKPPQKPEIISAKFITQHQGVATHIYPTTLEITFNWNWEDRRPSEIHFTGRFLDPPVPNPATGGMPGLILTNAGVAIVKRYVVKFAANGTPSLYEFANLATPVAITVGKVYTDASVSGGTSQGSAPPADDDTRSYKLQLYGAQLNFTTKTRLWYTIYAKATELKNPALFSADSNPIVINVSDPNPVSTPVFPPDIKWASLPDVSNTSRYHLKITAGEVVPGAVGYAIYRATEMSLRDRMNGLPSYPTNGTIFQRRTALNAASPADKKAAKDAFIRVNKELITDLVKGVELEMNGDVDGLYIYAISSFTDQNAESDLSSWIYVAVPQRITPGVPVLTGFVDKTGPTPKAKIRIDLATGDNTASLQLFKTAKSFLAADMNLMGLPFATGPGANFKKYRLKTGAEPADVLVPDASTDRYDYLLYEETIVPAWTPLYYRAAALGKNAPADGLLPGRSPSSNLLELLPPPPPNPPDIINAGLALGISGIRLSFKTNAYSGISKQGVHVITIYRLKADGTWEELLKKDIPAIPKLASGAPTTQGTLYRLQKDATGYTGFQLDLANTPKLVLRVVVADPLGRTKNFPDPDTPAVKVTGVILKYEQPSVGLVIKEVSVVKAVASVTVGLKTNVSKQKPATGQFTLEILVQPPLIRGLRTLLSIAMHTIPDKLPILAKAGIAGGAVADSNGLYTYAALFSATADVKALQTATAVVVRITSPKGEVVEQSPKTINDRIIR